MTRIQSYLFTIFSSYFSTITAIICTDYYFFIVSFTIQLSLIITVKSLSLEYMATCRKKYLLIWTYNFAKPMTLSNIWQPRCAGAVAALHKIFAGWLTRFAENLHMTVCAVVVLFAEQAGGCSAVMTGSDWRSAVCWYIHTVWCCSEGGGGYSQHWPGCTKFLSVQLCPCGDKILLCLYT